METTNLDNTLKAAIDFEKKHRKKLDIERNIALGVDAATNLASMLARTRGAIYPMSTNNTATVNKKIAESEQRMVDALRDYNGRIAALAFRSMMNGDEKASAARNQAKRDTRYTPRLLQPLSFIENNGQHRPQMANISRHTFVGYTPLARKSLRKQLFSSPISLLEGRVQRHPLMTRLRPLTTARPLSKKQL